MPEAVWMRFAQPDTLGYTAVVLGALQGKTKAGFAFKPLYTRVYVLQDARRLVAHQSTDAPQ